MHFARMQGQYFKEGDWKVSICLFLNIRLFCLPELKAAWLVLKWKLLQMLTVLLLMCSGTAWWKTVQSDFSCWKCYKKLTDIQSCYPNCVHSFIHSFILSFFLSFFLSSLCQEVCIAIQNWFFVFFVSHISYFNVKDLKHNTSSYSLLLFPSLLFTRTHVSGSESETKCHVTWVVQLQSSQPFRHVDRAEDHG